MTLTATSAFTIDVWKQEEYDTREGITLGRAHVEKTFMGEIAGTSTAELLLAGTPSGPAAYVGIERFECAIAGRAGSFLLQHSATQSAEGQTATWNIVPGSGTGELAGLRGDAQITVAPDGGHTLILSYELA